MDRDPRSEEDQDADWIFAIDDPHSLPTDRLPGREEFDRYAQPLLARRGQSPALPDQDRPGAEPDAPLVLALHGITGNHLAWAPLHRRVPGHTILAPDLRGRGLSSELPGPFGIARHADDAAAVLAVRLVREHRSRRK